MRSQGQNKNKLFSKICRPVQLVACEHFSLREKFSKDHTD